MVDDGIREAIGRRSQDQRLIEQLARTTGFRTLYEDGLVKVAQVRQRRVLRVTWAS
jgi:general secretion pathway protein E